MDGGTGLRRNNRKRKFIKSYNGEDVVESYDRLRTECYDTCSMLRGTKENNA